LARNISIFNLFTSKDFSLTHNADDDGDDKTAEEAYFSDDDDDEGHFSHITHEHIYSISFVACASCKLASIISSVNKRKGKK
jgi:hypothetical protein